MSSLMRIATYGQTNPVPIPETEHLTPEQRAEYTFILTDNQGEQYLIPEKEARKISPFIEHLGLMDVFVPLD